MAGTSSIEWTDATWNPVRGCSLVSPGCTNCYAMRQAHRFSAPGGPYEGLTRRTSRGPVWTGAVRLVHDDIQAPLGWRKPRMVFVNSMSDLFHDDVGEDFIIKVAEVMASAPWHVFQVLTKRSDRMRDLLKGKIRFAACQPHIWWGVSVEDRRHGLPRIAHLRAAPAATRFLSIEPLLEDVGQLQLDGIHWVIVGGESGPHARPLHPTWVRSIRQQCKTAKVPFFFKQWGGTRKAVTGRMLDGRTYDEFPIDARQ